MIKLIMTILIIISIMIQILSLPIFLYIEYQREAHILIDVIYKDRVEPRNESRIPGREGVVIG